MNVNKKLLEKIKKLQALSTSSHLGEAENAKILKQRLMDKYDITIEDIELFKSPDSNFKEAVLSLEEKKYMTFKFELITNLLKNHFFINIIYKRKEHLKISLIGKKSDTQIAQYLFVFLDKTFEREWLNYRKAKTGIFSQKKHRNSFFYGLYHGLNDQLNLQKQQNIKELGLIVIDDKDKRDDYTNNLYSNIKKVYSDTKLYNRSNYSDGHSIGKKISLNPSLSDANNSNDATQKSGRRTNPSIKLSITMAQVKQAVILAAGMGTRLRSVIGQSPKGLLKIKGQTLIDRSLNLLVQAGIEEVVMVTGFMEDTYKNYLNPKYNFLKYALNPIYQTTGSMHSLMLAENLIKGDFLLLESDLIYELLALSSLLKFENKSAILTSGKTNSGDEVYIYGKSNIKLRLINEITKTVLNDASLIGELVGISKISYELFNDMLEQYKNSSKFKTNYHYEDCLSELSKSQNISSLLINDLLWAEIDDPSHLKRVLEKVLPLIEAKHTH